MCMMWALFIGTIFILLRGPTHPSVLDATMTDHLQRLYAGVLCLGTGCCITGFLSGTRWLLPRVDPRVGYRLAVLAIPANVTALSLYFTALGHAADWDPIVTLQNGVSILAIIVAHCLMAWDFFWEIKRIDKRVNLAIGQAKALQDDSLKEGSGDDTGSV